MAETVTHFLQEYLSPPIVVFIISMLPILELRGGMVAAALLGIPWGTAIVISVLGNMLPIPFILLFIRKILDLLKKTGPFRKIAEHFESKALRGGADLVEKYPTRIAVGLWLFVAIPLPMTGAWTGSLIAAFIGLPLKRSAPAILCGILTASIIMSVITYVIPWLVTM